MTDYHSAQRERISQTRLPAVPCDGDRRLLVNPDARIYIAGHHGLVGSAILRNLQARGFTNFVLRTHAELDLENQAAVCAFFAAERPEYVLLAAAKVGGRKLLFLGSSCIYPKHAPQPMKEECLLNPDMRNER